MYYFQFACDSNYPFVMNFITKQGTNIQSLAQITFAKTIVLCVNLDKLLALIPILLEEIIIPNTT